jgi:hypothetical protein
MGSGDNHSQLVLEVKNEMLKERLLWLLKYFEK